MKGKERPLKKKKKWIMQRVFSERETIRKLLV